ncbi:MULTISPECIES: DUF3108 domain-containing protein [Xanthomonas translucens group]|uniref:DUF3108 domain-containing protein n=1 Tax=Xanthomonas cerealis pv. cerealis TaxID=152263 RepID=A0A514E9Y7_9XANT|nr:DUF3108 domain-containing protein [Xanthomonas translucens]QDI02867.1 DUF3108 domain-containing protein [Xanthomonas translucens pv. cerealis]UKE48255.1 DUF3108 domain-containing protein [Xanthomonas translucens pv. cerealis]UKE70667.1 DUF3108 domain-containing protein [Xanthomonas translucens pv. pistacia]
MSRISGPLSALTAAVLSLASVSAMAIEPFQAKYQANYLGAQAAGTMTLTKNGSDQWTYNLDVKNIFIQLNQTTVFDTATGRLRPLSSDDVLKTLGNKSEALGQYDWNSLQATWSGNVTSEQSVPVPLTIGDLNPLLVNLAIVSDVNAGNPLSYNIVNLGKTQQTTYEVVGTEAVSFNGKIENATKISYTNGSKQTLAWIVPDAPAPVRVQQTDNGKQTLLLVMTSLN